MKSQEDSCYVNSNTTWNLSAWEKELSKISVTEKIKQRKVKGRSEDQSEDFRYNKQHSWLSPVYIGQAQVEEKTYTRGSQSTFSLSFLLWIQLKIHICLPSYPHMLHGEMAWKVGVCVYKRLFLTR